MTRETVAIETRSTSYRSHILSKLRMAGIHCFFLKEVLAV